MDDEQLNFLSRIMKNPPQTDTKIKTSASSSVTNNKMKSDEDAAIIESKISQIKELFPDYGRGFLVACLEAYNHNSEEVIQRILEGTLHEELQSLDISLDKIHPSKPASSVNNKYDKGKGKLVEPTIPPPEVVGPTVSKNQAGASSGSNSSSVGRFMRKNTNDLSESETLNATKEKELAKTAALISQQLEYEDEYDDSFDDLGMSVGDSGLDEPETLGDKIESDGSGGSSSKWGSRKKPQFYVKDGKNYSYKVDGSVAASNYNEAKLLNLAQKEMVHGLGRGGNMPFGAVKRFTESKDEQDGEDNDDVGRGGIGFGRGSRGRRGVSSSGGVQIAELNDDSDEVGGRGNGRGGGGRRGRGRGRNQFRRDRAMSKHLSGLPAHFNS